MAKYSSGTFIIYFICRYEIQENEAIYKIKEVYYFCKERRKIKLTSGLCGKVRVYLLERTGKRQFWRTREPVEDLLSLVIEARNTFKGERAQ